MIIIIHIIVTVTITIITITISGADHARVLEGPEGKHMISYGGRKQLCNF